jgi:type II secretory pathway predicted ATPase ExeA/DNA-binding transcriptional MerR regulator
MYYEYWGMHKAPFDNVPDPTLYWDQNNTLEDAICEVLFAVEEGNDCLAVMVGDIGTGKTLGLRVILNELDPEKYRIAFVTNPDLSLIQFLREINGQLLNKKCESRFKDELMEEFNTILFDCANQGQTVVVFVDEANVMSTENLHNLRLLTNLQEDQRNMVIFVLAGQPELGKKLESKALENLFQRVGVYCRIKGLSSAEEVKQYITHRITACGGAPDIFADEVFQTIYENSRGVPRLINKLAKICLKAGETNQIKRIDNKIAGSVSSMFSREKRSIETELDQEAATSAEQMQEEVQALAQNLDRGRIFQVKDLEGASSASAQAPAPEDPEKTARLERGKSIKEIQDVVSALESGPASAEGTQQARPAPPKRMDVSEIRRKIAELEERRAELAAQEQMAVSFETPQPQPFQAPSGPEPELMDFIKGLPSYLRDELKQMKDDQLMDLAGKIAVPYIEKTYPQKSIQDPVVLWETVKGRVFTALKTLQVPGSGLPV